MLFVIVVLGVVVVAATAMLTGGAALARASGQHAITAHATALIPRVLETARSTVTNQVYTSITTSNRTGLDPGWAVQGWIPLGSVALCSDQTQAPCRLRITAAAQNLGCTGAGSTSGSGDDTVTSVNVDSAAYVADEQRCTIFVRYAVFDPGFTTPSATFSPPGGAAGAAPAVSLYETHRPGVFFSEGRRLTLRIFGAFPYAAIVGVSRDVDFNSDQTAAATADAAGNGVANRPQTYDPSQPAAFNDTMAHSTVAERHRPGSLCNEGKTWGAQNGPGIELDGGCHDSVPAPSPLPNGPYDFPATTTWNTGANPAKW